jgi:hypothetical protein
MIQGDERFGSLFLLCGGRGFFVFLTRICIPNEPDC